MATDGAHPGSVLDQLAELSADDRAAYIAQLNPDELDLLIHEDWSVTARRDQMLPEGIEWLVWLIRAGRGWGKLLDVDTPIPTPGGWTRLGDITPGDVVYDEAGQPCTVTDVHDDYPQRAWRIRFSDGATLVAGGEHRWATWTTKARKAWNRTGPGGIYPPDWTTWRTSTGLGPTVVDTDTIAATLEDRHSIPTALPLAGAPVALPIDPWVLGAWLGDGSTGCAAITCHDDDAPHFAAEFARRGDPMTRPRRRHADRPVATYTIGGRPPARDTRGRMTGNGSLHSRLKDAGLLGRKRIPAEYLRSPVAERLDLLRGLMDTDGYAERSKVEFTTADEDLAGQVLELVRSLGERPAVYKGTATLDGVEVGPKWRIVWRPARACPFLLKRKADRCPPPGAQASRLAQRMIDAVDPAPLRPMRCLTVDSPSHLFLAGDAMIPTHNTLTGANGTKESIAELEAAGVDKVRTALLAPREEDILTTMIEGETGLVRVLPPSAFVNGSVEDSLNRSKLRLTLASGAILQGFSGRVPGKLRGPQHHLAWVDEPATLPDARKGLDEDTAMSNLLFGLRLPPWNRLIITGTPRNVRLIRELRELGGLIETHGRTRDNLHNLSRTFKRIVVARYAGTRLGRQELDAEMLEGVGVMFARGWFPTCRARPGSRPGDVEVANGEAHGWYDPDDTRWRRVRMWDLAATEPSDVNPDPDWTVGVRLAFMPEARDPDTGRLARPPQFVVEDVQRCRLGTGDRDEVMFETADADGLPVQWVEREPASSGKSQLKYLGDIFRGIASVREFNPSGPKGVRAELTAGPAQKGQFRLCDPADHAATFARPRQLVTASGVDPDWSLPFLDEHEEFHPDEALSGPHDDIVDATSAAAAVLLGYKPATVAAAPADSGNVPRRRGGPQNRGQVALPSGRQMPRPRPR